MKAITQIADITELEPRVNGVLRRDKNDCRINRAEAYNEFKAELTKLVGWFCKKEELQNEVAYEITLDALCDALEY